MTWRVGQRSFQFGERRECRTNFFRKVAFEKLASLSGPIEKRCDAASLDRFVQYIEVRISNSQRPFGAWTCGTCSPEICGGYGTQRGLRRTISPTKPK
jgi:hypothetical protein